MGYSKGKTIHRTKRTALKIAKKDWKKFEQGRQHKVSFIHKSKKTAGISHSINIIKIHSGWGTLTYPYSIKYERKFKTKSQALTFARKYMKKH